MNQLFQQICTWTYVYHSSFSSDSFIHSHRQYFTFPSPLGSQRESISYIFCTFLSNSRTDCFWMMAAIPHSGSCWVIKKGPEFSVQPVVLPSIFFHKTNQILFSPSKPIDHISSLITPPCFQKPSNTIWTNPLRRNKQVLLVAGQIVGQSFRYEA